MKRYDLHDDGFDNLRIKEVLNGDYVLHSEAADTIASLTAQVERLRAALAAALPHLDNSDSPGGCNGRHKGCDHCEAIALVRAALQSTGQRT